MALFAEVILPLPLYGAFTYSVPEPMRPDISVGCRVLVQFGRRKFYTGIVSALTQVAPQAYEVKPITAIFESAPITRHPQLRLWEWISSYYLCSPGEVFKAAVPTGLKPESETYISLNPDFDAETALQEKSLPSQQLLIIKALSEEHRLRLSELEERTAIRNAATLVARMLRESILEIDEHIVDKYRPKTIRMVRLSIPKDDPEASGRLHECFNLVSRSARQEKALVAYLDLSGWMQPGEPLEVSREQLYAVDGVNPGILKALADKGIFEFYKKSVNRYRGLGSDKNIMAPPPLSPAQLTASREIAALFRQKNVVLLHGVTGSGKTEIYARLIDKVLKEGNQVLYLVPEISLTTQMTDRMRRIFGDRLLVYHSRFSDSERADVWLRLLDSHEPCLVLGVRSSLFLPFHHLGLVIVDEEHESSYKQYDPAPRYNARDTAIMLASMHGAPTLLGSATPAIETYYKALAGKYGLVTLSERFDGASLPEVEIVDMRDQRKRRLADGIVSRPLKMAVDEALEAKQQAILFQNRRGFSTYVHWHVCGWTPRCVNCDVSLVYHKHSDLLRCHYCGFSTPLPKVCPACGENAILTSGYGTERIAEEIHERFPSARVARMDLDTTRSKDAYQNIIEEFARKDTDILVGTQMVSKGLDFKGVTVVGALNADTMLKFPDFRATERAFNMLEQVAGRAGRSVDPGRVVIQTSDPENPVLAFVKAHDYLGYYQSEIEARQKYFYPPYSRIINIYIKNKDSHTASDAARLFAEALRRVFGRRVLGPEPPLVSRIAAWYLRQIMLKVEVEASMAKVKSILRTIFESLARDPRMKSSVIYYDVDPA